MNKRLIRRVCFEFGVDVDDLFIPKASRKNEYLAIRVCCYFLYERMTIDEVRLIMGIGKSRTVMNAVTWVRDRLPLDSQLRKRVDNIRSDLRR